MNIREQSRLVGKLAMDSARKRAGADLVFGVGQTTVKSMKHARSLTGKDGLEQSKSLQSLRSIELVANEESEIDVTNNEHVQVDFRPLYQCLHIHEVLGIRSSFRRHYEENRRLQANLVLTTSFSLNEQDLDGFVQYLNDIIGFFIVEYKIGSTTEGFRPRASIDTLWDATNTKLYEVVVTALQNCENPAHYLKIKELVITFIQTAEQYSYTVHKLIDMLLTFFESYSELLKTQSGVKCRESVMKDECNQLVLHDSTELATLQKTFKHKIEEPVHDASVTLQKLPFPMSLPFTESFVVCVGEVKKMIELFHQFSDGFHQHFNEMDDILCKGVESLFTQNIFVYMSEKVEGRGIRISEIVRMLRNLEFYTEAVGQIERQLEDRRLAHRDALRHHSTDRSKPSAIQSPSTTFSNLCAAGIRDTQKQLEKRLFEVMNQKVDDFIECAEYDFCPTIQQSKTPTSPTKNALSPSPYLTDLITFLKTVWQSTLADLPESTKSLLYYSTFFNISNALLKMLTQNPMSKRLSPVFLHTVFWQDLECLREFVGWVSEAEQKDARKTHSLDLGDQLLDVQQALYLCTGIPVPSANAATSLGSNTDVDVEGYLDAATRSRKFNRLDKETVTVLLERVLASGVYDYPAMYEYLDKIERKIDLTLLVNPTSPSKTGASSWFGGQPQNAAAEKEKKELDFRRATKKRSVEHVIKVLKEKR